MGGIAGPSIVQDNLILALDAATLRSYPGSGGTITDLSEKSYDFTTINGTVFESASNGGIVLDGGNESLHIADTGSISYLATSDFSIETVVRSDDGDYPRSRHPLKLGHTVYSSNQGWSAGHGASSTSTQIRVGDGSAETSTNISHDAIQESTYYHRVFTVSRDSGCLTKYYINSEYIGQQDASTVTGSIYDPDVYDGSVPGLSFGYVWGWRFIGSFNILRVYNKVLTQSEIVQNYNATKKRFNL